MSIDAAPGRRQFACLYCGYVYDEAKGAPEHGVPPGTLWEDLPEDWCCPMCSAEKGDFQAA
jgi:rubredoxin